MVGRGVEENTVELLKSSPGLTAAIGEAEERTILQDRVLALQERQGAKQSRATRARRQWPERPSSPKAIGSRRGVREGSSNTRKP